MKNPIQPGEIYESIAGNFPDAEISDQLGMTGRYELSIKNILDIFLDIMNKRCEQGEGPGPLPDPQVILTEDQSSSVYELVEVHKVRSYHEGKLDAYHDLLESSGALFASDQEDKARFLRELAKNRIQTQSKLLKSKIEETAIRRRAAVNCLNIES